MSSGNAWIQHLWNGDIVNIRYRVDDPDDYRFEKMHRRASRSAATRS